MKKNVLKYELKMKLLPSHFDLNDKIKPESIFSIFQDVASHHGELMGIGFEPMIAKHLYWVVTRVKFDILLNPEPYQDVIVETWPHPKGKVDMDRDYLIKDLNGEVLIKGSSKWCVISTVTRKFEMPEKVEFPDGEYVDKSNYTERFVKTPSIEKTDKPDFVHKIAYHEIDHNLHLNNVHYAEYVFNVCEGKFLSHLQINFILECKLGDKVEVFKKQDEDGNILVSGYVGDELKFSAYAW